MSEFNFLDTFNNYTVQEFVEFLKNNGLSEFETVAIRKNINGHTFLNLAEFEINNWKPLLSSYQAHKFWSFLNQLRQAPENFVFVAPAKPVVNKLHLQELSQNPSFLNSLRNAVQNRVSGRKNEDGSNSTQNRRDKQEPIPPRPLTNKKPLLLPPKYNDSESDDSEIDRIYESPDEENGDNFKKKTFERRAAKPLPTALPVPIPKLAPVPTPKPLKQPEVAKQTESYQSQAAQPVQRQPFRFEKHYIREREKERELAKSAAQTFNKGLIHTSPLPPIPTLQKEALPRRPDKLNTIPRPPRSLPQVTVHDFPESPEEPKPKPMEQESYYRYTDRRGAEALLTEEYGDGTFLLRPSRTFHGTLSVRQGDKVYHLGITKVEDNTFEMESLGVNLKFQSLNEVIAHFKSNPLTVRNRYNQIVDIYLIKTLPADRT